MSVVNHPETVDLDSRADQIEHGGSGGQRHCLRSRLHGKFTKQTCQLFRRERLA